MNKLLITDDIVTKEITDDITVIVTEGFINKVEINIKEDVNLEIYINTDIKKYDFTFNIDNSNVTIYEIKEGKVKAMSKYNINSSILNLFKINECTEIRTNDIINLNNENSKVNYTLKTASTKLEKYNIDVYHNDSNTISDINNYSLAVDGVVDINVSSYVPNGNKNCIANQVTKIINLNNCKCTIRPNLYIDEFEVEAEHTALIDNFKKEELFYMQRLGINIDMAKKLLIKGFLVSNIEEKYVLKFDKYWR